MPTELFPVRLVHSGGAVADGVFSLDEDDDDDLCRLVLRCPNGEYQGEADDYSEAMCSVRRGLEESGWHPQCFGASRDVYPSGLSRGMGSRGRLAYRLRLGRPARTADAVNIFAYGPGVEAVSVEEQAAFYARWLRSLGLG